MIILLRAEVLPFGYPALGELVKRNSIAVSEIAEVPTREHDDD